MKHYFARITENNGGMEYDTPYLFITESSPAKHARKVAKDWRSCEASDWDKALQGYWADQTLVCVDDYREIPEADFDVLKKYLAVL
jgi:sugar phosphate isomerase/epimerase